MKYPRFIMIEIYSGKNEKWKGWHNLCLDLSDSAGDHKAIAGPIDPETSKQIIEALKCSQ